MSNYVLAKEQYAAISVDTEKAIERLSKAPISIHCWQGDDVRGFLFNRALSGGIQTTGNDLGRARTAEKLRAMLEPTEALMQAELAGDFTARLALVEEYKTYPFGAVYDEFCRRMNVPVREAWFSDVRRYEKDVLAKRDV